MFIHFLKQERSCRTVGKSNSNFIRAGTLSLAIESVPPESVNFTFNKPILLSGEHVGCAVIDVGVNCGVSDLVIGNLKSHTQNRNTAIVDCN